MDLPKARQSGVAPGRDHLVTRAGRRRERRPTGSRAPQLTHGWGSLLGWLSALGAAFQEFASGLRERANLRRRPIQPAPLTMIERRREEEQLLERLRNDCQPIADAFGLRWSSVKRTRSDAKLYGCCDADGNIRIRLRSRTTGEFLRYSSLIATMCHELAHLRYMDHGPEFRALDQRLLRWAREQGVYQPVGGERRTAGAASPALAASAPARRARTDRKKVPKQLTLFPPPAR